MQERLRWWQRGDGPALVLVHGFAGGGESWRAVIEALPRRLAVATVTLPGHSADEPVRPGGFAGYVDWLLEVLRPVRGAHVAGYSAGGRIVLGALARELKCATATLVSSGVGSSSASERAARRAGDREWATLLRTRGIDAFLEAWEAQPIFATQAQAPAALRDAQRAIRRGLSADALANAVEALSVAGMPNLAGQLKRAKAPVQLVVGALDAKYMALAASLELRRGRHVLLEDCGHNPLVEAPTALAGVLQEFVSSVA